MSIFSYIKSHVVLASTVLGVAVVAAVIGGRAATRKPAAADAGANTKQVSVVSVADFRTDSSVVSVDGVIQSVSQADLRSQISAPISTLAVSLGQYVTAGQIIAELSNADIQAQLDQAKLSLSAEGVSLDAARKTAIDAARDSYLNADEVIHTQLDPMLFNTTGTSIQLSAFDTDPVHYQGILTMRADLTNLFITWKKEIDSLSTNPTDPRITAVLRASEDHVQKIQGMLDAVAEILNKASTIARPSDLTTVNTWKATVSAGRATISGTGSSLIAADRTFSNTLVTQGGNGAAPSTIAQSGVKNLEAQLAKTIIRSPIDGTVAALPLRSGELATAGTLIATVVGNGGLQVDAFASAEDIARITRGAKVAIDGTVQGAVTSISPSVNPINKKVEVKILVTGTSSLVIGENVNARIQAVAPVQTSAGATYRMPIQNVKIVPGEAYVFTVGDDSKLVKHTVTLGEVSGDFVEVKNGITADMKIVTPVYELEEGQEVTIH